MSFFSKMATPTSKFVNKRLVVVILLHFDIVTVCHVSANQFTKASYIFKPTDIAQIVPESCFVGINSSPSSLTQIGDSAVKIRTAFEAENDVLVGLVDLHNFTWPSGKEVQINDEFILVVFPRIAKDRTCLSTKGLGEKNPKANFYKGSININLMVEFVNIHCNTYRNPNGYVSIEGLHREEIINSLFQLDDGTNVNMQDLYNSYSVNTEEYCTNEYCNNSESVKHLESYKYIDKQIPFKSKDLPIKKCEIISVPHKKTFFHDFLKMSKPVIIKGAIDHWPALQKWSNEYFRRNYGDKQVHIKLTPTGEFEGVDFASQFQNYYQFTIPEDVRKQLLFPDLVVVRPASTNMNFSKFLDVVESVSNRTLEGYSAYLEYSSIADIVPELEDDITEMPFFTNVLNLQHLNIWLSDGDTLGKLHFDPFDNFLCQISGRKQVILFEPHENRNLYEAHIPEAMLDYNDETKQFQKKTLVDATSMVMSPLDITKPDFERFPLFAKTYPLNCTIEEGDVLFMPAFWWHEVQSYPSRSEKRNLAVNFWYEPFLTKEFPCQECSLDINPKYRHLLSTMN